MTLSHDVTGTGPAVLLLHSTVADRRMWNAQLPALTGAGFQAVRCDLQGFGGSPMSGPYDDAQDVADLLDELGIARTAVIAASGGGRVALRLAARWPARVSALALLCTAVDGHQPSDRLRAFGAREDELLEAGDIDAATELNVGLFVGPAADEATRDFVRTMQRQVFQVQLALPEQYGPIEVEYDLAAVTARSLLVSGAHDVPDFQQIAEELTARLPQGRHVRLDWAGHLPSLERPDVVNALLLDFLTQR